MLCKNKSQRLGANGGDEVLAHPFFQGIDLERLLQKRIRAPFLPKTTDPEMMRQSSEHIVRLKELRESVPDQERAGIIREVDEEIFGGFGTNIDQSAREKLESNQRKSAEMHRRQLERAEQGDDEEKKPLPHESRRANRNA